VRFSINLSLLFADVPFLERFARAAEAGFDAVEFWWPTGISLPDLAAAVEEAGVDVAMFNFDGGDMASGERGYLNDPEREGLFREHVSVALELAARLGCDRINALVGVAREGEAVADQLARSGANVAWAAEQAARSGVTVLVEALNTFENGPYLLTRTAAAAAFVDSVGQPNVKLQYDAYHMQRMEGNLSANLGEHVDRIGHIQIADSPGRNEPGTGEINFDYVLGVIESSDYDGWVGLEYRPSTGSTEASLGWLPRERRGYARTGEASS
jgi:hydroxypyruvate isomerase